jgi:3-dehydroquinate dehydratase-2
MIINPADFSFGSVPIWDALKLIQKPLIEVHITDIHKRDKLYQHSLISTIATGVICGLAPEGYLLAMRAVASAVANSST